MMRFAVGFLIFLTSFQSMAYVAKEGNISAVIGPFFSKTNFTESRAVENDLQNGVAIIAVGDFNDRAALEVGIFYMNKQYYRLLTPNLVAEKAELMHVTMGYRRWFTRWLSGSLSFFSSYSIGQAELVYNDFPPGGEVVDTSARDITEYGLDLALQFELMQHQQWAVILDTRYSLSVTDKQHESGDHYGALIGIRYMVQERGGPDPKERNIQAPKK
jgi:hypothetical protein